MVPAIAACAAGAAPENGTWIRSMQVRSFNSSTASCDTLPTPGLAKVSLPGAAFAFAIRSDIETMPDAGRVRMTLGESPRYAIGAKSFAGS